MEDPSSGLTRFRASSSGPAVEAPLTEAQLREVFNSLPNLAWTCLPDGPCDYLNRQWVAYTGVPEAEQLGYGWLEQIHPDDRDKVTAAWNAAVGRATAYDTEFRIRRADGAFRWFRTRAIPLRDATGKVVKWYGSNSDVDDYKRTEEALRRTEEAVSRLNAELERRVEERTAQLMAANRELEAFSYSVAHDLRAPLRGMNGFAQVLLDEYANKLSPDGVDCLREIHANAAKMGQLIDALLSLSRLARSEIRPERVDLTELATSIARALSEAHSERGVALVVAPDLQAALDPQLARVLLENLLANAWKFTAHVSAPRVEIGRVSGARASTFFIRDNGAGFDMAYAHKLFVPFQRLHSSAEYSGTGIGLATVHRIVHRHGGEIWAEGRVGGGASIYFTIPELQGRPA